MERTADETDRRAGSIGDATAPAPSPVVNIVGEQVALGPLNRALLPLSHRWVNDLATIRNLGMCRPKMMEQEAAWYDHVASSSSEQDVVFTIYERATWRPIGTTELSEIDHRNGRASFGIMIGEHDCRGKGYGTEATSLMLDYAFTALGLHNVMLRVFSFNSAALRAYTKAGFREFGRRRECYLLGGRRWDDVHMECLSTEFTSPALAGVLLPDAQRP